MLQPFIRTHGALHDVDPTTTGPPDAELLRRLTQGTITANVIALVPESVAREHLVVPLHFDGETVICAAVRSDDLALQDKLRFMLAKNVRFLAAPRELIVSAIQRYYAQSELGSIDSAMRLKVPRSLSASPASLAMRSQATAAASLDTGAFAAVPAWQARSTPRSEAPPSSGANVSNPNPGASMFFYTVEEGQRVLMVRPNGTMRVIVGPQRVWKGKNQFRSMQHFVAHPDKFLILRYRDGRQEHVPGPAEVWLDPRHHLSIVAEDSLQIAAKEAVVVYSRQGDTVNRRIVYGPAVFVPQPGEWLHTFTWHASVGGHSGVQKVPKGLVFQKLWMMPDQMYHDVTEVRTADDAVLIVRLMIFFELIDVGRMLDETHDPIGDFVNAATSDVVEFVGKLEFECFKRTTERLNELETYRQLTGRAAQCGYRINKVVYRGYDTAAALQEMHDRAIEARTKLQLDRATEQQTQDLEDYKLQSQLARAARRREEQTKEVTHDLELADRKQEAELRQREAQQLFLREAKLKEAGVQAESRRRIDTAQREHLSALRELGVDLTAYLTQARADRVIELRGKTSGAHVHLDSEAGNGKAGQS